MYVSGQLHAPAALPQGKISWYPLDRRLGGPQSRSGCSGEEKISQLQPELEPQNPDRPVCSSAFKETAFRVTSVHHNTKMNNGVQTTN
jgi:hypothetical protein